MAPLLLATVGIPLVYLAPSAAPGLQEAELSRTLLLISMFLQASLHLPFLGSLLPGVIRHEAPPRSRRQRPRR